MEVQYEVPKITFQPADKEVWLQKIISDLKGKKIPQDFVVNTEGIVIDPFLTESERIKHFLPLDRMFDETKTGIFIEIQDDTSDNQTILTYLQNGASALFLDIKNAVKPEILFENIHLQYLFVCIKVRDENMKNVLQLYFDTFYKEKSLQAYIVVNGDCLYPVLTKLYKVDISKSFTESIIKVLQKVKTDILQEKPLRTILIFEVGKNFLFTISTLRAFRILWENLVSELGFEGDIPLIVGMMPNSEELSTDPDQALIEWTYMALSGFLGNTDICFSLVQSANNDHNYNRTAFLAQQILLEEGKIGLVKDPVAGSLFIEEATQKIASSVWQEFI